MFSFFEQRANQTSTFGYVVANALFVFIFVLEVVDLKKKGYRERID